MFPANKDKAGAAFGTLSVTPANSVISARVAVVQSDVVFRLRRKSLEVLA
jgi:hypothetical protein